MRVASSSIRRLVNAVKIEVRKASDFDSMFYVLVDDRHILVDASGLGKFWVSEAAAWKWVGRYVDLDKPGLQVEPA